MSEVFLHDLATISEPVRSTEPLRLSESAAEKVLSLIGEEGNPNLQLRISVSGGGCSGFQYEFAFEESSRDEAALEGDTLFDQLGVRLAVDAVSLPYLMGAEVDFEEGLEGARFVVKNPNALTTCSCGNSFNA